MNGRDKKVLSYLKRAKEVEKELSTGVIRETFDGYLANVIEIAKMIQTEEQTTK